MYGVLCDVQRRDRCRRSFFHPLNYAAEHPREQAPATEVVDATGWTEPKPAVDCHLHRAAAPSRGTTQSWQVEPGSSTFVSMTVCLTVPG